MQQISNQLARIVYVQRFKLDRRVALGVVSRRYLVEAPREVLAPRAKDADDHQRYLVRDGQHAFQQLDGGRIDPVQVFKYQHQRLGRRQLLEEIAGGNEHPLAQLRGLEVLDALVRLVAESDTEEGRDERRGVVYTVRKDRSDLRADRLILLLVCLLRP